MSCDSPGFVEVVSESQACFRAVLEAMAHPSRLVAIGESLAPLPVADPATAAVALTLLDADTPVWLDSELMTLRPWLGFHCGAPIVARGEAAFVIAKRMPPLEDLRSGTHETPEESATLILQVASLEGGMSLRLEGPGLAAPNTLRVDGLPLDFPSLWAGNHGLFPLGIDLILCSGTNLAALPRSVSVKEA